MTDPHDRTPDATGIRWILLIVLVAAQLTTVALALAVATLAAAFAAAWLSGAFRV